MRKKVVITNIKAKYKNLHCLIEDPYYRLRNQFALALANCIDRALLVELCFPYKSTYSLPSILYFQSSNFIFFLQASKSYKVNESVCISGS